MSELIHSLHAPLLVISPEVILATLVLVLLTLGAFWGDRGFRFLTLVTVIAFLATGYFLTYFDSTHVLGSLYVADSLARFLKITIYAASAISILLSVNWLERKGLARFEYPILILIATLGMSIMVSANDFMTLYLGLELQSLTLYVLASYNRNDSRSTEAGLKYFILGALASGSLLYGISLVYGFSGTTSFTGLRQSLTGSSGDVPAGFIIGMVFILAGLAFKISAVPFHMWAPDVYQGAPTPVVAFFASAPKVAAMGLLIRVTIGAFMEIEDEWRQIIVIMAILSLILGAYSAIAQTKIKRLLAYSSIGHMGFALLALAVGSSGEVFAGVQMALVYMVIYCIMSLGAFLGIMAIVSDDADIEEINDLAGLSQTQPLLALAFAMLMFSLAGIPLLAGFFGKLFVLKAVIEAGLYVPAVIAVLAAVVSAYYYLRVVKIIYFDPPKTRFQPVQGRWTGALLGGLAILVSPVSFFYIAPLLAAAREASRVLHLLP